MSITYEEALETLQAMFQEPWTRDSLDAVLRHQRGHMENTVDLILRHGTKDPQVLIDQLDAGIDPNQSALELDEQLARQLAAASTNASITSRLHPISSINDTNSTSTSTTTVSSTTSNLLGTPTILPEDFLRVPNFRPPPQLSTSSANGTYSISDDEALARMLQDELFTEELRRNPDFAHLAGRRSSSTAATSRSASTSRMSAAPGSSGSSANPLPAFQNPFAGLASRFNQQLQMNQQNNNNTQQQQQRDNYNNNNIMEKLSEMGDGAKRRLQLMAAQFQQAQANIRNGNNINNTNTTGIGSGLDSATPGTTSASERRSLLMDDTDDMELAARKDL